MVGKLAVVAALLLSLAEGCEKRRPSGDPPINQGPANVHCSVTVDYPHWSTTTPSIIDGKVRVVCRGSAIDELTIDGKLQRRENGEWYDLPSTEPPKVIAPVKDGERYTLVVPFPCSKVHAGDVFRTAGRASGMFGGKPAGSATWVYNPSGGREVKCQK